MGHLNQSPPIVLLADANVLIDFHAAADIEVLKLVGRHVGRVAVLAPVLDEVRGVTRADCRRAAITVVDAATDRLLSAAVVETRVSFNDRLCFAACREEGWTCVTNDRALRRLCERHGVPTRYGLRLLVDVVAAGAMNQRRAMTMARAMHKSNPLHINERVIAHFKSALDRIGTGTSSAE